MGRFGEDGVPVSWVSLLLIFISQSSFQSSPWKHRVPSRHLRMSLKHRDSRLEQAAG